LDVENKLQVSAKSLQIIILLEEISRLNHKEKELKKLISSSSNSSQS